MAFNPLEQTGIPVDAQFRNWSELNVTPFEKYDVDPYPHAGDLDERDRGGVDPVLPPVEIGQLQVACEHMRRYEGRDPAELLPPSLPDTPVTFEPNKDYVRQVLAEQIDLRTDGTDYVSVDELPRDHRYFAYQATVNEGGAPSEQIIDQARMDGGEYRDQTEGDHPVADLRPQQAS